MTTASRSKSSVREIRKSGPALFLDPLDNLAAVQRLVEFYVTEHNERIPHGAFGGDPRIGGRPRRGKGGRCTLIEFVTANHPDGLRPIDPGRTRCRVPLHAGRLSAARPQWATYSP